VKSINEIDSIRIRIDGVQNSNILNIARLKTLRLPSQVCATACSIACSVALPSACPSASLAFSDCWYSVHRLSQAFGCHRVKST